MSDRPTNLPSGTPTGGLSRVPYLPGLDGLRAIAVVAVMIYHANHTWLKGGFLGVEVFFVISGYLITLLLMGEDERTGGVNLRDFWMRRARRLLPALYVMMALLAVYITAFYPAVRAQTRGDFVAGIFYVSNWYQIIVGQGYASSEAFVPLRHLWSLAVEEQYYFFWPLVMVFILHRSRRRLPSMGLKLIGASFVVAVVMGLLFADGFVPLACSDENSNGYWTLFGRCISVNDTLYLGSISRSGGLLLGAGFAMLWRPAAIMRGPLRDKGRRVDIVAAVGMVLLLFLFWTMYLLENGRYNPWLFRGGFFITGLITLMIVAGATHQGAATGKLLGTPVLNWIGTRSYGLYLYHWPIFQIIRKQAQIELTLFEFVFAMALTCVITEASYRWIETPIRKGQFGAMLRSLRADPMRIVASVAVLATLGLATVSMVMADPQCVGAVECSLVDDTTVDTDPTTATTVVPTAPGQSTTSVSTTTTLPPEPEANVAIGESVMVGARSQLQGQGVLVNAEENRGPNAVRDVVAGLVDQGVIGEGTTVVVQVGTNGPVTDEQFDAIVAAVPSNAAGIVVMTVRADLEWIDGNNERIGALPARHPNVTVLDWNGQSQGVELCPDGVHITCSVEATNFYANLILGELGLPAIS
jgi:peptidoglycan/LPS O-acetylase OafA/YrhL